MASVTVNCKSYRVRRWCRTAVLVAVASAAHGCASTDELFAQYDAEFCPAPVPQVVQHLVKEKPGFRDRIVVKEIEVPAAAGKSLPWEPAIYFESDSDSLSRIAQQSLRGNVELLQGFAKYRVSVRGFTDEHSSAAYNARLATRRIDRVRDFLLDNGIAAERVIGRAHGESFALARQGSPIADDINRRVELLLLDEHGRPLSSRRQLILGPTK